MAVVTAPTQLANLTTTRDDTRLVQASSSIVELSRKYKSVAQGMKIERSARKLVLEKVVVDKFKEGVKVDRSRSDEKAESSQTKAVKQEARPKRRRRSPNEMAAARCKEELEIYNKVSQAKAKQDGRQPRKTANKHRSKNARKGGHSAWEQFGSSSEESKGTHTHTNTHTLHTHSLLAASYTALAHCPVERPTNGSAIIPPPPPTHTHNIRGLKACGLQSGPQQRFRVQGGVFSRV